MRTKNLLFTSRSIVGALIVVGLSALAQADHMHGNASPRKLTPAEQIGMRSTRGLLSHQREQARSQRRALYGALETRIRSSSTWSAAGVYNSALYLSACGKERGP